MGEGEGEYVVHIAYPALLHYQIDELKIRNILVKLVDYLLDEFEIFATSVVESYTNLRATYNIYIEYPCDLKKIRTRLLGESPVKYKYLGQIIRDFELIATNCEIFNHKNPALLTNAVKFREYYYWILPKMLSRVGISVSGNYKDTITELSQYFPLNSPMFIDGNLYPITSTDTKHPSEDSVSLIYAHMQQLPEVWQSSLVWGVILIVDAKRKQKITTNAGSSGNSGSSNGSNASSSGNNIDIDLTDIPEAYLWLRGQIIKYERHISNGMEPLDIPTWQEEAGFLYKRDLDEDNSDSIENTDEEQCASMGSDQLSLPELSDDVLGVKDESNSRKRKR